MTRIPTQIAGETSSAAAEFNPYFKWLGIPPEEQPPNHYRLLAIPPFTSDPEVIENAADQRMAHLRAVQTGKRGALSQSLLDQIAQATVCLLDQKQKAAYDEQLRRALAPPVAPSPVEVVAVPPVVNDGQGESSYPIRKSRKATSPATELTKIVLGGIAGLAVGYLFICWISPRNDFLGIFAKKAIRPTPVVRANAPEQVQPVVGESSARERPSDSSPSVAPIAAEEKPKPVDPAPGPSERRATLAAERDAAVSNGNLVTALRAVRELAELSGSTPLEAQLLLLSTWKTDTQTSRRELANQLVKLLEQAVAESKFELSARHVDQLLALARSLDDQELQRRATLIALKRANTPNTPQPVVEENKVDSAEYHDRLRDPERRSRADLICAFRRLLTNGSIMPIQKAPDLSLDEIVKLSTVWTEWHVHAIGLSTELDLPSFEKVFGTPRSSKSNFGGLSANEVEWTFVCKDGDVVLRGFWQETPKGKTIHFETARFRHESNTTSSTPQAGPSIANKVTIEQVLSSLPKSPATKRNSQGKLTDLDLSGVALTDSQLTAIGSVETLRVLHLPETKLSDAGLEQLSGLSSLTRLEIFNTEVTSDGMRHIAKLSKLEFLSVGGNSGVGDQSIAHLSGLKALSYLGLNSTGVTDDGIRHLTSLPSLKSLGLNRTKITDRGLEYLAQIKTLTRLSIVETAVTDAGVAKFKADLPSCEVIRAKPQP